MARRDLGLRGFAVGHGLTPADIGTDERNGEWCAARTPGRAPRRASDQPAMWCVRPPPDPASTAAAS
ncbi:MAG: hypothetical protein JJ992_02745, partial [Planctomycetes bacterium]|nr:hypothetical protein [Planctomycetota bacterium]